VVDGFDAGIGRGRPFDKSHELCYSLIETGCPGDPYPSPDG